MLCRLCGLAYRRCGNGLVGTVRPTPAVRACNVASLHKHTRTLDACSRGAKNGTYPFFTGFLMHRLNAIFLTVLTTVAALPASASTTLHVQQGPLSYRIIDLTPSDGVAAAVTFLPTLLVLPDHLQDPAGAIDMMVLRGGASEYYAATGQGKETLALRADAAPQSTAQVTISHRESPWSEALVIDAATSYSANVGGANIDASSSHIYFELAPNTAIEFASDSLIQANVSSPQGTNEWIQGATYLAIGSVPYDWNNVVGGMQWIEAAPWGTSAIDISTTLTGRYENHSAAAGYGYAYLASSFRAISAAPVPEPSRWALLATGLVLLGVRLRRRA